MHLIISYLVFVEGTTRTASTGCPQYSDFNTCFREGNGIADGDLDTSPPFQSTPPRGERHSYDDGSMQRGDFNPRSREGSDNFSADDGKPERISTHAPARGATFTPFFQFPYMENFNPRSREGSDTGYDIDPQTGNDFNPRSREGSDDNPCQTEKKCYISLHAPARGATREENVGEIATLISIHAPARGATRQGHFLWRQTMYFNPRSREGSDA